MNSAAFIYGARDVRVESSPAPTSESGKVAVDVAAVGLCGSDLHYYKDGGIGSATIDQPFTPGHEFAARLQTDVESRGLHKGQLVAVDPALPCHQCQWCQRGHHNLCPSVVFLGGPPYNGAMTQSLNVPIENLVELPDGMTADQGAMLEPLGVCLHALDLAKPGLLDSIAILGCGPIGLGILQLLQHASCGQLVAVDPLEHRRAFASRIGADCIGHNTAAVLDATGGLGCDLVIEATNSPDGLVDAVKAAKIGATLILVGIPDGDLYTRLSAAEARRRGLTIKFSRRMGSTVYPRAIDLVSRKKVDVDALVSHHFSLSDTAEAFALHDAQADGVIKSIITIEK
ncbi:MAG: alcohol dehydrogenase catalytic domain-containing protein [Gammaproteobacteria bacterium]|nr:alcohol dehydrogenase catalytic domain-containing protein [Gammaproteobacteria bacterium]